MIQNTDNVNKSEVKEDVSCTIDKENNRVQYLEQMCEKLSKTVDELSQQLKEIQINNTSTEKKTTSSNTETDNTNNNNVQIKYVYMNPPTPKYTFDGRDDDFIDQIVKCQVHSYYYYAFNLEENYYGREFKSEIRKLLNIDTNTYDNHGSYFDQYQEYYQNMYNGSEGSFDSEEESEYQSQGIDDHEFIIIYNNN
ncbi:hypothetical protein U3516DRAFT_665072 [Neocallimastix sp. 'constans']